MVNKLITQFGAGSDNSESYVFICIDCDKYDSDPADRQFLTQAEEYCQARQNYDLIWFCRDVEDVFLGHMVADKQKKAEANRFVKNHMIDHIDVHRLTEKKYKAHSSNIRYRIHRSNLMEMNFFHRSAVNMAFRLCDPLIDRQDLLSDRIGNIQMIFDNVRDAIHILM